ncbi:MAG: type II toxin-antitoxin system YafQ family toxin [Gemmataceae bacterium]
MRRTLLPSTAFIRAARRLTKKNALAALGVQAALDTLADDAFHSSLKTHKLTGDMAGSWACSAGYDLRIVFDIIQHEGAEAILLLTVGTHDEVY